MTNAKITGWKKHEGEQGDGSAILGDDLLSAQPGIPAELVSPSTYARATARAEGIELVWTVRVALEPVRRLDSALIAVSDRVRIAPTRRGAPAEWFGVVSVREMDEVLEVGLGKKVDGQ
ncbi:MAG: hypothetical protein KJZ65_06710 [Phycisphaerales bacterium]|nr:hypothetical protein [Phycisphaerales bacterium]